MIRVWTCLRKINIKKKLFGTEWWFSTRKGNPSLRRPMESRFPVFADIEMRLSLCENLGLALWTYILYCVGMDIIHWNSPEEQERWCQFFPPVLVPWESFLLPGSPSHYFISLLCHPPHSAQLISHSTNPCTFPLMSEFFADFGKTTRYICLKCVRILILCSRVLIKK